MRAGRTVFDRLRPLSCFFFFPPQGTRECMRVHAKAGWLDTDDGYGRMGADQRDGICVGGWSTAKGRGRGLLAMSMALALALTA